MAGQDALGTRISHIEQIQAQQQAQLQQPQQLLLPAHQGLQPAWRIHAGGPLVLGGGGLIAAQPLPPPQGPSEQAALSVTIKAHGKVTADLWRSWEGQKVYAAHGCFHVSEGVSYGLVRHVLTTFTGASDFLVLNVCPPAPAGEVPTSILPAILFGTFIAAFMAVLEFDIEDAPVMCTHTVRSVREALEKVEGERLAHLPFHRLVLALYNAQMRDVLIQAINADIKVAMHKLAVDAAVVRRQHPLVPTPPGSGTVVQPLTFKQLRARVE